MKQIVSCLTYAGFWSTVRGANLGKPEAIFISASGFKKLDEDGSSVDRHANWSDPVMADIYRVFNVEVFTTSTNVQRQHKNCVDSLS